MKLLPLLAALTVSALLTPLHAEHNGKLQVLLLGDSTTEARIPKQHQPKGPHFEDIIRILMAGEKDMPPCNVINSGVSGEFIRRLLDSKRYERDVQKLPGLDYIFIRYGINDQNKRENFTENFTKDYQELLALLKKDHPKAQIIIMTIIPYGNLEKNQQVNALNEKVAKDAGLPLFDIFPRYLAELKKGENMLNYRRISLDKIPPQYLDIVKPFTFENPPRVEVLDNQLDAILGHIPAWYADRHPNAAGYNVIADETAKYLTKMIREKKGAAAPATAKAP
ncbi:lysophospholipase L1-like esterase [Roseimicrobium gellanilyticum]|uniref:Lysophospholipase L1-like esterase n=1 Tax=Roseimicrobium gellanilyticum TaxID=748857 RepID=A0A366HUD9_9BACT|nr:SGNH/GDSL hydrolase family protein [Roseimicrobium gellanilyticum]RBP47299.1 lysophospholipase L1-like esterase [Roseimicrobium gellanilyticum]